MPWSELSYNSHIVIFLISSGVPLATRSH